MSNKTKVDLNNKTILITGSPGFIGANLVLRLLKELKVGTIISLDNMNDYYDPKLKEYRLGLIDAAVKISKVDHVFIKGSIADKNLVDDVFAKYKPDIVVEIPTNRFSSFDFDKFVKISNYGQLKMRKALANYSCVSDLN